MPDDHPEITPETTQPLRKVRRDLPESDSKSPSGAPLVVPPEVPDEAVTVPLSSAPPLPKPDELPPVAGYPAAVNVPCPRCGKRLLDPGGLGLCQACGYCQSLSQQSDRSPTPAPSTEDDADSLDGVAVQITFHDRLVRALYTPTGWMLLVGTGCVAMVLLGFLLSAQLGPNNPSRKYVSTLLLLFGLVLTYLAQWWALMMLSRTHESISPMDWLVISGGFWAKAMRHMPHTRWPILMVCWAITIMIVAGLVVGGLLEWLPGPTEKPSTFKIESLDR